MPLSGGGVAFGRLTTTIFAPSLASLRAIALPIPREAPVMSATFPSRGLEDEDDILETRTFLEIVESMRFVDCMRLTEGLQSMKQN